MKQRYNPDRKLRLATAADLKDNDNKLFFFKEGLITQRIDRMLPDDYNNWKWIKGTPNEKDFVDSCRDDWKFKTDMMKKLLKDKNLYIEKWQKQTES